MFIHVSAYMIYKYKKYAQSINGHRYSNLLFNVINIFLLNK